MLKKFTRFILSSAIVTCFAFVSVSAKPASEIIVYIADNTQQGVFHTNKNCSYLKDSCNETTLEKVDQRKFTLCSRCASEGGQDLVDNAEYSVASLTSQEVEQEAVISIGEDDKEISSEAKPTASAASDSKTSDSANKATTAKSSTASTNSGVKELLTQKQRKNKYASKTNPKRGTKVEQPVRNDFKGFAYADFSTYNSYSTENNLGRKPIYLLGTIMDIVPFTEVGNMYGVALMVNDCDGYQWYMRANISKDKYDMFKKAYMGKAEYIYGTYAGYSGVMNRPMMDATIMIEPAGKAEALAIYQ